MASSGSEAANQRHLVDYLSHQRVRCKFEEEVLASLEPGSKYLNISVKFIFNFVYQIYLCKKKHRKMKISQIVEY